MKYLNYKQIIRIALFPIIIFTFDQLVNIRFGLYEIFPWIDIPMHFLGGASIGVSATLFLRYLQSYSLCGQIRQQFIHLWLNMGMVSLAVILWEFYEFIYDYFFHTAMQPSIADTIGDMFFGLIGGMAISVYLAYRVEHNHKK